MCSRNERGGFQIQDLPQVELSDQDVKRILPEAFVKQLSQVWLCGNYGDPILAKDTLGVLRYLRETNEKIRLGMNTNGSARKSEWWREAASLLDCCHFGIDGLSDTNELYRRRTHWAVIMENAQAFINAGGSAHWEYIVFRHNEHQIEQACLLAKQMGFKKFRIRKTGRFFFAGKLQDGLPVVDKKGTEQYLIEPPTDSELRNTSSARLGHLAERSQSYGNYLDTTRISCKAQCEKEIYVSAEGLVFPCCYLANFYRRTGGKKDSQFFKLLEQHGGKAAIDGRNTTLSAIVGSTLFQDAIPNSWNAKSVEEGRLAICASTCGAESSTRGQYTQSLI